MDIINDDIKQYLMKEIIQECDFPEDNCKSCRNGDCHKRTFSNVQDRIKIFKIIQEKGMWRDFYDWMWKKSGFTWAEDFAEWLFLNNQYNGVYKLIIKYWDEVYHDKF